MREVDKLQEFITLSNAQNLSKQKKRELPVQDRTGFQGGRIRERRRRSTAGLTYVVNLVHSEKRLVGNARDLGLRRVHSEARQPKKQYSVD